MEYTFEQLNGYLIEAQIRQKVEQAKFFLSPHNDKPPLVTLIGPSGSGKKTLAQALAKEVLNTLGKNKLKNLLS